MNYFALTFPFYQIRGRYVRTASPLDAVFFFCGSEFVNDWNACVTCETLPTRRRGGRPVCNEFISRGRRWWSGRRGRSIRGRNARKAFRGRDRVSRGRNGRTIPLTARRSSACDTTNSPVVAAATGPSRLLLPAGATQRIERAAT